MTGLLGPFLEATSAGGVTEFGYPLWLALVVTIACLVMLAVGGVLATRSKWLGGAILLVAIGVTAWSAPAVWIQGATVRSNQFQVCTWSGSSYRMELRSLDQYRAAVRVLDEAGGEELHLTNDDGDVEVFDQDRLLAAMVIDEVADRLRDLRVPVVDRR